MSDVKTVQRLLETIHRELIAIRKQVEHREEPSQALYKLPAAAKRLGVGRTKLGELVKAGVVLTVQLDGHPRVPASEIARLCHVDRSRIALTPQAKRMAASLSKLREPIPGARPALLRARHAKRPRQSQDFSELDALLKSKPKKPRKPRL